MVRITQDIIKTLISYHVPWRCLRKEIIPDLNKLLSETKRIKHFKKKTISRRNKEQETVYSTTYNKKQFWLDIIKEKNFLDLKKIKLDKPITEELLAEAIRHLKKRLTHNFKVESIEGIWEVKVINKNLNPRDYFQDELKNLKKAGGHHKIHNK